VAQFGKGPTDDGPGFEGHQRYCAPPGTLSTFVTVIAAVLFIALAGPITSIADARLQLIEKRWFGARGCGETGNWSVRLGPYLKDGRRLRPG
jgi:hypothetical protein